mmetsp:Transcript_32325/g.53451  ORF Transcript_32325/g.53451 Transcript_32325/m.53451 type:complete len:147 (-) Transcript_32325:79-519(-)
MHLLFILVTTILVVYINTSPRASGSNSKRAFFPFSRLMGPTYEATEPCSPNEERTNLAQYLGVRVVGFQHLKGFGDLGTQRIRRLQKMEKLGVVHLKKHTSDLSSKFRLGSVDKRVEAFSNHVLLHLWSGRSESRGIQDPSLAASR